MELYTKGKLSIDVRTSRLQSGNDIYDDILSCLEDIMDLVNDDDGWVVYGWGKQGVINDVVMLGNEANKEQTDNKVLSEHVSTHVIQPIVTTATPIVCEQNILKISNMISQVFKY